MSTPPFIDLPDGVQVERWPVRGSQRAVMHAGLRRGREFVVLVPGFTGSKEDFIAMVPMLAEAGWGVLAYDQLGQYESDASDVPSDYALGLLASDLGEVVAAASARTGATDAPHLVGHSFGGLVVQEAVAGGHVTPSSLVLLCTGPGALPVERWAGLSALADALDAHDLATIWRIMREMEESEDVVRPAPDVARFLERRWHANSQVQLRELARLLMEQPELTDRVRAAAGPALPITVMWGENDDQWPVDLQAAMAVRLGAAAVELRGVGHSPNAEDAEATVGALRGAWRRGR